MPPSVVLSRPSPSNVPQGYASVAELPAALPVERRVLARRGWAGEKPGHFEHPAGAFSLVQDEQAIGVLLYRNGFLTAYWTRNSSANYRRQRL